MANFFVRDARLPLIAPGNPRMAALRNPLPVNDFFGGPVGPIGRTFTRLFGGSLGLGDRQFDPMGKGYDYRRAVAAGMGPDGTGENAGHWGSVAPVSARERMQLGLPPNSFILLKGKNHPTWDKAVAAEEARGSKVIQIGDRFYSVPKEFAEKLKKKGKK